MHSEPEISGTTPTAWNETFGYDGFGNLTSKVLNGGMNSVPAVDPATNRLVSTPPYDANGNMVSGGGGGSLTYDVADRLTSVTPSPGHTEYYGYGPDNKRNYKLAYGAAEEWSFYGLNGEKLVAYTFSLVCPSGPTSCTYQPARHFLLYLQNHFPDLRELSELRRDPHWVRWLGSFTEQQPCLSEITRQKYRLKIRTLLQRLASNGYVLHDEMLLIENLPSPRRRTSHELTHPTLGKIFETHIQTLATTLRPGTISGVFVKDCLYQHLYDVLSGKDLSPEYGGYPP